MIINKHILQILKNQTQWCGKEAAITKEVLNEVLMKGQQSLIAEQLDLRNLIRIKQKKEAAVKLLRLFAFLELNGIYIHLFSPETWAKMCLRCVFT